MGHTNQTTNLHLPQFIGSDKPTWLSDMNGAFLAIDNAYGTIEGDASAAATAAAGAVVTAGQANDTATAAAGTAATAADNASTALTTANNAAYTANQADSKASTALEIATGKQIGKVTSDGVKNWETMLNELFAALSDTPSPKAILEYNGEYYRHDGNGAYTNAVLTNTALVARTFTVAASGSKNVFWDGSAILDQSSSIVVSGRDITIYE